MLEFDSEVRVWSLKTLNRFNFRYTLVYKFKFSKLGINQTFAFSSKCCKTFSHFQTVGL